MTNSADFVNQLRKIFLNSKYSTNWRHSLLLHRYLLCEAGKRRSIAAFSRKRRMNLNLFEKYLLMARYRALNAAKTCAFNALMSAVSSPGTPSGAQRTRSA